MSNPAPHTDTCTPDPKHPGWFICDERHDTASLTDRMAYSFLIRTTFALAQALGYSIDDLKNAHDTLIAKGFEPISHMSDSIYEAVKAS